MLSTGVLGVLCVLVAPLTLKAQMSWPVTRPPPSFALAVRVGQSDWIGPLSLSRNGHFALKLVVGDVDFYVLPSSIAKPDKPPGTTEIIP